MYGLGSSTNTITLVIDVQTGDQIIIADKTGFASSPNVYVLPSITLTDG
jgi:hypothetical protein